MITTFTEKAGQNLKDRLINYKAFISKQYPQINKIDLFQLRVGTLHSLCNSIMLEYRYPGYKNYRPLDDLDQLLFIFFHSSLVRKGEGKGKNKLNAEEKAFWNHFKFAWNKVHWRSRFYENRLPSKWIRARTLQVLFNRIVEDMLDLEKMKKHSRPEWKILAKAYEEYAALLEENYRVDFAHMQKKFLNFLDHELGKKFVEEDDEISSRLSHVLVDGTESEPEHLRIDFNNFP